MISTLIEWIKRLIAAILAWLSDPGQGLTVPIEIAPDQLQTDRVPWLKIPLEVK